MERESLDQLAALAHPRRLAVFRLLMRRYPDGVPAGEIAEALSLPASSLSAVLAQLRASGLITQRRMGTSLLYSAHIEAAGELISYLAGDCCRGRSPIEIGQVSGFGERVDGPLRVLFLCSGNSCRSIMAECLLRDRGSPRFEAVSAGMAARGRLDPQTLEVLRSHGHDLAGLASKAPDFLRETDSPEMDFVFTLCDRAANEDCPAWPGQPVSGHWGIPGPTQLEAEGHDPLAARELVYDRLAQRIERFLALPLGRLDRATLQSDINDIALGERSA